MARSEQDLFDITVELTARVSLDLERIESDPVLGLCQLSAGGSRAAALELYVEYYIMRERFLSQMPSTNGPGTFQLKGIEGLNASENSSTSV